MRIVFGLNLSLEIISGTYLYLTYGDEKETAEAIKKALNAPDEFGKKARERIIKMFSLKKREEELIRTIKRMGKENK